MFEVGIASRLDLLRAEVRAANLKPPADPGPEQRHDRRASLKTLLGLDVAQPVDIVGEMTYAPVEIDLEESLANALANRPELSQLNYQRRWPGR